MTVRWKRHKDGDGSTLWTATIDGTHVIVVNMQGQSVRYTGLGPHVLVHVSSVPGNPFKPRACVNQEYTVRDAKAWAVEQYS